MSDSCDSTNFHVAFLAVVIEPRQHELESIGGLNNFQYSPGSDVYCLIAILIRWALVPLTDPPLYTHNPQGLTAFRSSGGLLVGTSSQSRILLIQGRRGICQCGAPCLHLRLSMFVFFVGGFGQGFNPKS